MKQQGLFYFISDDYFQKYDTSASMMQNKEGHNDRPCFYAFPDPKEPQILWCIPISSKVEKFERIAERKIMRQKEKGVKKPVCNTIRFGEVMGQKRAFLIQNMFPVTERYIRDTYIDKNTKRPVTIASATEKDVCSYAKEVLKLVGRGYTFLLFSDVLTIKSKLIEELS